MNIKLSLNKDLIRKAHKYATEHGMTLNQLIRDYLTSLVIRKGGAEAAARFLRVYDRTTGDCGGWRWNRAEIYGD